MSAFNFTALRGLSLLGDEKGAWMADTTAETLVGSELVTDGDMPSTTNWTGANSTLSIVSGELKVENSGSAQGYASQTFNTIIGETYILSVDAGAVDGHVVEIKSVSPSITLDSASSATAQTYTFTFVATTTTTRIFLWVATAVATNYTTFDNVTCRLAVPDLSTNENGLGVHGSIIKSAVATGADLVAYSNFGTSRYLKQPYNSDLDFGTGDFCVMNWIKSGSTGVQYLVSHSEDNTNNPRFAVVGSTDDEIGFSINGGSISIDTGINTTGEWQHVVFTRISGIIYGYIDGALVVSTANTTNLTNTSASLYMGCLRPGNNIYGGAMSLGVAFASGLTAAQIKTIYNKEKHLFKKHSYYTQEGVAYDLDLKQKSPRPSGNTKKNVTTTLSGKMRSIVHHEQNEWQINTSVIHRTDNTDWMRKSEFVELMYSTRGSEQFTYDPYGSVASEDEPITVQRVSNQYSLVPEENTEYFRASFTVREVA